MNTIDKLNEYAELESWAENQRKVLDAEKQALLETILTAEQKEAIREINAEYQSKYDALDSDLTKTNRKMALRSEIIQETIEAGHSWTGSQYSAVLTKEKTNEEVVVDTGMLVGMTVNIPKLKECWHKESTTTPARVTIRRNSK